MCHGRPAFGSKWRLGALLGLFVVALVGCAPKAGWERVGRVCAADGPPTVCLEVSPDQPVELRMGDVVLVPGECVRPRVDRGGRVVAVLRDGRGGSERLSFVVGTGRRTVVNVGQNGELDGVERSACDATVR